MFNLSEPDMTMFETFSDNLKKKIQGSPEWEKLQGKAKAPAAASTPAPADEMDSDDIPF
jgi:hypothetical protein